LNGLDILGKVANDSPTRVWCAVIPHGKPQMAKPNYQFEKRQRELQKKRKKEAKARKKAPPGESHDHATESDTQTPAQPGSPVSEST
jgi:hypothetical protein